MVEMMKLIKSRSISLQKSKNERCNKTWRDLQNDWLLSRQARARRRWRETNSVIGDKQACLQTSETNILYAIVWQKSRASTFPSVECEARICRPALPSCLGNFQCPAGYGGNSSFARLKWELISLVFPRGWRWKNGVGDATFAEENEFFVFFLFVCVFVFCVLWFVFDLYLLTEIVDSWLWNVDCWLSNVECWLLNVNMWNVECWGVDWFIKFIGVVILYFSFLRYCQSMNNLKK